MAKGSNFEREICKDLSRWWTQDEDRDDVFWRSSNSGGRATVRGRKGKKTYGHAGDIAAVDPIGEPLLKFVTIEVKRGYSSHTFAALLDRPKKAAQQTWEAWIQQAIEAHERSGSFSWMIIAKRDQRERIVMMSTAAWDEINEQVPATNGVTPFVHLSVRVRFKTNSKAGTAHETRPLSVVAFKWESWINNVTPLDVKRILKRIES